MSDKKKDAVDILQEVGLENVSIQFLHGCLKDISTSKKSAKITFLTDPVEDVTDIAHGNRIGMICWFDRKHLKEG